LRRAWQVTTIGSQSKTPIGFQQGAEAQDQNISLMEFWRYLRGIRFLSQPALEVHTAGRAGHVSIVMASLECCEVILLCNGHRTHASPRKLMEALEVK
jgi:hypothetical protein